MQPNQIIYAMNDKSKGKSPLGLLCCCAVMALGMALAKADGVPYAVASFPVYPSDVGAFAFFASGSTYEPAQTFLALQGGQLQDIYVALCRNAPQLPGHVIVDLRATAGGAPTGPILVSASISGSLLAGAEPTSPEFLAADFSASDFDLAAGTTYAFSLRVDATGAAAACGPGEFLLHYYPYGHVFNSFDSGESWAEDPDYYMNFEVTAIPEPGTIALIAEMGLVFLCARRPGGRTL